MSAGGGASAWLPSRAEQAEGWRAPGQDAGWLNPLRERFLLRLLVRKELRVRYRGSALGMLWSYVKPAVQFIVFYIALGVFLQLNRDTPAYAVYLFSGIVVVNLFGEVFGNATRSITGNQALVSKIYLPSELFPWASMIVALVHFLPQLLVLVVGALLFGWMPSFTAAIAFGLGLVILVVFTMGLGMITAALNAAFRDVENFVDLIVMVATWLSPVLYRISMVEAAIGGTIWWWLYQLNPLTIVVELFHVAFWRYTPETVQGVAADPSLASPGEPFGLWWAGMLIAVATFVVGTVLFERSKRRFAQEL
ncbi:MAG: ABC transporter permease [Brachybacterium sp.]|uniref:ABC transporter permease n=1 Tax=Brachybacterium sp. TaxID=1891286 RepID=UPI002651EBC7|nr:ABC transporter permease [Brachybacterium sp.]MDN6329408.1 ABC transporter permease [Brachybacterium sp.]MDN6399437.1 ABC transporter permease [Brachybacterium sp.]